MANMVPKADDTTATTPPMLNFFGVKVEVGVGVVVSANNAGGEIASEREKKGRILSRKETVAFLTLARWFLERESSANCPELSSREYSSEL